MGTNRDSLLQEPADVLETLGKLQLKCLQKEIW